MGDDDWVSIVDACPNGISEKDKSVWRKALIDRLRSGRLEAKAANFQLFYFECPGEALCDLTGKCSCSANITCAISRQDMAVDTAIPSEFWELLHDKHQDQWPRNANVSSVVADWVTGDFATVRCEPLIAEDPFIDETGRSFWPPEYYDPKTTWVHWALDVKVRQSIVRRINAQFQTQPSPASKRSARYDWVSALTHLVGVAELEGLVSDPDEYGAQAKIERALADWFANSGNDIPSEAAIRPYAAKVLAAIKAQGQKAS